MTDTRNSHISQLAERLAAHGDLPNDLPTSPNARGASIKVLTATASFALIAVGLLALSLAANNVLSIWSYFAFGYGELH